MEVPLSAICSALLTMGCQPGSRTDEQGGLPAAAVILFSLERQREINRRSSGRRIGQEKSSVSAQGGNAGPRVSTGQNKGLLSLPLLTERSKSRQLNLNTKLIFGFLLSFFLPETPSAHPAQFQEPFCSPRFASTGQAAAFARSWMEQHRATEHTTGCCCHLRRARLVAVGMVRGQVGMVVRRQGQ